MRYSLITATLASSGVFAARPFINEPDTGIVEALGANFPVGSLPDIKNMVALNDFEWAARNGLPIKNYTYYRNGAGGEWSYRNNLEVYNRYRFKPRMMVDITKVQDSLPTSILGHNFSAPFYISPCARADYAHPNAEVNLVKGAAAAGILYIPSLYSTLSMETIAKNAAPEQTLFAQLYIPNNDTETQTLFDRAEKAGYKAIVWTIDSPGDASRQRAARFDVGSSNVELTRNTWEDLDKFRTMTKLPIMLKGVQTAAVAKAAIEHKVPAIVLSNHGGRNLDGSPSALEVAIEMYQEDPTMFQKIEVYADGGVRYGTDALRLLALGVRAVGVGRPFMYANAFGQPGVEKVAQILKHELTGDSANLGVPDLKKIDADVVNWTQNGWYS
ncbi:uncharacterized protein PG998_012430 [Apiospora kogelbergensis]|uniref:FMN hydroxy acid dehydrogenase domain-containing protein n=1 Tax=Apiospora kogelbergensis TaxID=1337665 RepID=A0AAW0QUL5_9PEZI